MSVTIDSLVHAEAGDLGTFEEESLSTEISSGESPVSTITHFLEHESDVVESARAHGASRLRYIDPFNRTAQHLEEIGFTGVADHWASMIHIDAKIIQAEDEVVTMECLLDPDNRVIEEREFPRRILEGLGFPLKYGQLVLIRIFEKPGKIQHVFNDGTKLVRGDRFEKPDRFEELRDAGLDELL